LEKLNEITFKYTLAAIEERLPKSGSVVIDAPLLFESGLDTKCDVTIAVLARLNVRVKRIMGRDNITEEQALIRINAQKSDDFFIKSADYVVNNNGEDLTHAVVKLKTILRKIAPKIAVYCGTFSPPTLGHLDIIKRAAREYDILYVGVLQNVNKKPLFTEDERVEMLGLMTDGIPNVRVERFNGLLVDFAIKVGAHTSVRGVRKEMDLDMERQMFSANEKIARIERDGYQLETVFIPTTLEYFDTSSSLVRELLMGKAYKVASSYLDPKISEQVIAKYNEV
jgi:pantetheine-phosphate adenylyltransferase